MLNPLLRFHGAAHTVTGSCYEIEAGGARILIDCGLFQGSKTERELNYGPFPFKPSDVDAVILTHAHIDHSGLLPKLVKHGFAGPIHTTPATIDLCSVMLPDAAHIQEMEVEQLNRRNLKRGRPEVTPIYTMRDAEACMTLFRPQGYCDWINVARGFRARFWNAGHLLGSASVEIEIANADRSKPLRLLFSGDIGPDQKLLQSDPEGPGGVDYLICESTYGDRERGAITDKKRREILANEVQDAVRAGGPLIIPSFAVERMQELLVDFHYLTQAGDMPSCQIFIDSPLATRASKVFERHANELDEGPALRAALNSHNIRFTESVEQSKAIDRLGGFFIVIAASGMCDAGRIRHHLKSYLWRRNATVMMAGFQAQGTLGRILLDGASGVRIQGEEIKVKARIRAIDLYSGHADAGELVTWVQERLPVSRNVFLTHGEDAGLTGLGTRLAALFSPDQIIIPQLDDAFELSREGGHLVEPNRPRRLPPEKVAHLDWHNDLSKLLLQISEEIEKLPDERGRAVLIRRLRRALESDAG
jgi:metallo-beta-lactamase family protein